MKDNEGTRVDQASVIVVNSLLILHNYPEPFQNPVHLIRQDLWDGPPKARLQLLRALLQQLQIRQFFHNLIDRRHHPRLRFRLIFGDLGDSRMVWWGS